MAGVPYIIACGIYGVSRAYYSELKVPAQQKLDILYPANGRVEGVILINREFIKRCVVALALQCRVTLHGITRFCDSVMGYHVSKGTIYNMLDEVIPAAIEFDERVPLENIQAIAPDEIFQQNEPVLDAVDLGSRYIFLLESAKDRTGATWETAFNRQKEHGLMPEVSVSDGGSGLLKGFKSAFPEGKTQMDVFHALREIGIVVGRIERNTDKTLSEYCKKGASVDSGKARKVTLEKYSELSGTIDDKLMRLDNLLILHSWLKECVGFNGYGYAKSFSLCNWILDEMSTLYPKDEKFQETLAKFWQRLPDILAFNRRLAEVFERIAKDFGTDCHSFMLMYNQTAYSSDSEEYGCIEKKLYHIFGKKIIEARSKFNETLHTVHRASSMIENLNSCIRPFMNQKRKIPERFFILLKVFLNTEKAYRTTVSEWEGTSAIERLTGQRYPEFLDLMLGEKNYIFTV